MILDSGPCAVGVESTVIEVGDDHCTLLRPGGISVEELKKVVKIKIPLENKFSKNLRSPGQLKSHYAPRKPMVLLPADQREFEKQIKIFEAQFKKARISWPKMIYLSWMPGNKHPLIRKQVTLSRSGDDQEAAVKLFEAIREIDKMNPDLIIAQSVPTKGLGLAIMDRLLKASSGHRDIRPFMNKYLKQRSAK
jgi:L-threonylcarbamoyladenylate synthase